MVKTLCPGSTCACMRRKWQAVDTRPQPGLKYLRMRDHPDFGLQPCSVQATLARSNPALLRSPGLLCTRSHDQDASRRAAREPGSKGVSRGGCRARQGSHFEGVHADAHRLPAPAPPATGPTCGGT